MRRVCAVLLLLLLAACADGSPSEAEPVVQYDLSTISGEPVGVWGAADPGRHIAAGVLRLRGASTAEFVMTTRDVDARGAVTATYRDTVHGTYTRDGQSLRLALDRADWFFIDPRATVLADGRMEGVLWIVYPGVTVPLRVTYTP